MRVRFAAPIVMLGAAFFATLFAYGFLYFPGRISYGMVGLTLCWALFVAIPWAVLPVGILGSTIASVIVGVTDVRTYAVAHLVPLAAGGAALLTRRMFKLDRNAIPLTRFGGLLAVIVATVGLGSVYGLAVGNLRSDIVSAAYQIGVIPTYFVITVYTLDTPRRLRSAAVFYTVVITVLSVIELLSPGRHGGLLALLPLPTLIYLAGRVHGWARTGLATVAAILAADVLLGAYRGVWLAGAVAMAVLLVRGGREFRRGLAATGIGAGVLLLLVVLDQGVSGRVAELADALGRSSGYRGAESGVGWDVFLTNPFFGAGLGQTTPDVTLPGFTTTDVGPVYHSFYIGLLANLGVIGLVAVMFPILRGVWTALRGADRIRLSVAALTCGFLAAAFVEAPTDGHWEFGLLPGLIFLLTPPAPAGIRSAPAGALSRDRLRPQSVGAAT